MSFFTIRPTSGTFRNSPGLATLTVWYCFRSKCPGAVFTGRTAHSGQARLAAARSESVVTPDGRRRSGGRRSGRGGV